MGFHFALIILFWTGPIVFGTGEYTRTSFNVCIFCVNTLPTHRRMRIKYFRNFTRIEIIKFLL